MARRANAGHQQGPLLHHTHHTIDIYPVALLEGPRVDQHQTGNHVGGHGARAQGRQNPEEQPCPLEHLAAGARYVGEGDHQARQQDQGGGDPASGLGPLAVEPMEANAAALQRRKPGVAEADRHQRERQNPGDGEQVGDGRHHSRKQPAHQVQDLAAQSFGNHLGGRKEAQQQGDQQIAGQGQQEPVQSLQQQQQAALHQAGGERLVRAEAQLFQRLQGLLGNGAPQPGVKAELPTNPEDVDPQHQQGQGRSPQPGTQTVTAPVARHGGPQLLAVAAGQLLPAHSEGCASAIVYSQQRREAAIAPPQPHHCVGRHVLHREGLGLHAAIAGQFQQPLAPPLGYLRWGLGTGGGAKLEHGAAIEADPGHACPARRHQL